MNLPLMEKKRDVRLGHNHGEHRAVSDIPLLRLIAHSHHAVLGGPALT